MSLFSQMQFSLLAFGGVELRYSRSLLARSTEWSAVGQRVFVFFNESALLAMLRGVAWHDDPEHCRTWSSGCRCDLGGDA